MWNMFCRASQTRSVEEHIPKSVLQVSMLFFRVLTLCLSTTRLL